MPTTRRDFLTRGGCGAAALASAGLLANPAAPAPLKPPTGGLTASRMH